MEAIDFIKKEIETLKTKKAKAILKAGYDSRIESFENVLLFLEKTDEEAKNLEIKGVLIKREAYKAIEYFEKELQEYVAKNPKKPYPAYIREQNESINSLKLFYDSVK